MAALILTPRLCVPQVWSDKDLSIWVKPLSGGRWAALLFNAGERAADLTLSFKRDLAEGSKPWEREVTGLEPACEDSLPGCKGWAQSGECLKNPGVRVRRLPVSQGFPAAPEQGRVRARVVHVRCA